MENRSNAELTMDNGQLAKPGFKRGDRVEILRGKHKGQHGTYENETIIGEAYPVLVVWLDGKKDGSYFMPGDLKVLHVSGETKANPTA